MSNKKTLLIIVVIILAVVAFLWWQKSNQFSPQATPPGTATELDQINKDLLDLDISDIDKEFEEIDKDLDTL